MSGWSDGPGCPDVIFGIPVNSVPLRRDFVGGVNVGLRPTGTLIPSEGLMKTPREGRAPLPPPLDTSLISVHPQ